MESLAIKAALFKTATGVVKLASVSASGITAPLLCSAVIVVGAAVIITKIYKSERRGRDNGSPPGHSWSSFPSHGKQTVEAAPAPGSEGHRSTTRPSRSSFSSHEKQTEGAGPAPGNQEHGNTTRPSGPSFLSCGVQTDGAGPSPGGQGHRSPPRSSGSSFSNCGVQTDGEGPAPDHGTHSESPRQERIKTDQGELRKVHAPPEASLIRQQQKKRRKGAAVMFFIFGVIAIAAIVAIYMIRKENRNKKKYDNERPSLYSNCHCFGGREKEAAPSCPGPKDGRPSFFPNCHSPGLGGTKEDTGTAPPCLHTSTRCKTKVTEEREGSTELPFKSTDTSQKILEELQSLKSQMSKKEDTERDLKLEFRTEMKEMKQSVALISTELKQINEKVQALEEKTDKIDRAQQRELIPLALPEMRGNEACLRFRAIPEQPNENIRKIIIELLTIFLERQQSSEMDSEVDQVYRMNSSITTQRNLPRDVIVHFVRKQTKDQVLQQHYEITLKIQVKDMVVLKEIPERILHSRKEYGFLADKLKQKILFRMERSKEMTFTFEQSKFQENSIQKAEEFLHKYKRELEETGELGEEESEAALEHETNEEWKQGEDKDDGRKICSSVVDFTKLLAS